jgi:hypothetical protein
MGGLLAAAPLRRVVDSETRETLDNLAPLFIILTIVGFVTIGPWLCMLAGRGIARVSRRVPALIAARRIASDPSATFRAVSVVVLAAFAVTCSASLVDASEAGPFDGGRGVLRPGVVEVLTGGVPEAKVAPLLSERAVPIRSDIGVAGDFVESCAELARVVTLSCSSSGFAEGGISERAGLADTDLPISTVYIPTDRTPVARRQSHPGRQPRAERDHPHPAGPDRHRRVLFGSLEQLQCLVWYFVLLVAACSLTVGMLAGATNGGGRSPRARPASAGGSASRVPETARRAGHRGGRVGLRMASSRPAAVQRHGVDAGRRRLRHCRRRRARRLILSTMALPKLDAATRRRRPVR